LSTNIHATALIMGDHGILIRGASGSGKTTLALALMQAARGLGRHAALIADDQLLVEAHDGRLIVTAPPTIASLAEAYGLEPRPVPYRASGLIDLAIDLTEGAHSPRFQEGQRTEIAGVALPLLVLEARQSRRSCLAIAAWFAWPPFAA
jgi:serine kinase of HPr protein (carbohydrate metabolism regulator)